MEYLEVTLGRMHFLRFLSFSFFLTCHGMGENFSFYTSVAQMGINENNAEHRVVG